MAVLVARQGRELQRYSQSTGGRIVVGCMTTPPRRRWPLGGLALTLFAVSAGVSSSGGFALLFSFAGVLAGASIIFSGVRMADDDPTAPAPIRRPAALAAGVVRVRVLVHCLRHKLGLVGLLLASSGANAATVADRETAPVVSFCAFALLLLGLSLLNVGVLLLGEEE